MLGQNNFWSKVDKTADCWVWLGYQCRGYGRLKVNGKFKMAHRVLYELVFGPVPQGLQLDHLCRNRLCVNPGHLEAVTPRENTLRGNTQAAKNAAKTFCLNGHSFSGYNLRMVGTKRRCRACARARRKLYSQRKQKENFK